MSGNEGEGDSKYSVGGWKERDEGSEIKECQGRWEKGRMSGMMGEGKDVSDDGRREG